MTDSYYTTLETREQDRIGRAAQLRGEAYRALFNEYKQAFDEDPTAAVRTPGFSDKHQRSSLLELIADELQDEVLYEAMRIVRDVSRGQDCQLQAMLWVDKVCAKFATYHCDDLANHQMEDQQ